MDAARPEGRDRRSVGGAVIASDAGLSQRRGGLIQGIFGPRFTDRKHLYLAEQKEAQYKNGLVQRRAFYPFLEDLLAPFRGWFRASHSPRGRDPHCRDGLVPGIVPMAPIRV